MCVCPPIPFYVDHGGSRCVCVCVFVLPYHSTWIMGGVGVCVCVFVLPYHSTWIMGGVGVCVYMCLDSFPST